MLFLMVIGLYTSRVLLESLGVSDFGLYNVVAGFVAIFSFLNNSMAGATQRFLTFALGEKKYKKLEETFVASTMIHVLIALIIIVLAETIGLWFVETQLNYPPERSNAVFWVYQCSVFSCAILFTNVPFSAVLIAHEKMNVFAYISMLEIALKLVAAIIISYSFFDNLIVYAFLILGVQIIINIVNRTYCRKKFPYTKFQISWNKVIMKELFFFAGWSLWGNIASVLATQGTNILLNIFFGTIVNAARGISVQVQNAVNSLYASFQQAINPQITKSYAQGDLKRMHSLIFGGCKYSAFLLYILVMPVILETNYILSLWLKNVPEYTAFFVKISLLASIVNSISGPLGTSVNATGKIRVYQTIIGGLLLFDLPISFIFLKLFPNPEIVFIVQLFTCIIVNIVRVYLLRRMLSISIRLFMKEVVFKVFIVGITSFIFLFIIHIIIHTYIHSNFSSLILLFLLNSVFLIISIYSLGLNTAEREFILNKVQHVRKAK